MPLGLIIQALCLRFRFRIERAIRGSWADSRRPNERGPPAEGASLLGFVPQGAVVNGGNQTM